MEEREVFKITVSSKESPNRNVIASFLNNALRDGGFNVEFDGGCDFNSQEELERGGELYGSDVLDSIKAHYQISIETKSTCLREELRHFIWRHYPISISEVLDYKLLNDDSRNGIEGRFYEVVCKQFKINGADVKNPEEIVRTCIVDADVFNDWRKKRGAIKWL